MTGKPVSLPVQNLPLIHIYRDGSRYADHEIEVDTAVETAVEEDGTLHPLIAALLEICLLYTSGMVVNSRIWLHRLINAITAARDRDESIWITIRCV